MFYGEAGIAGNIWAPSADLGPEPLRRKTPDEGKISNKTRYIPPPTDHTDWQYFCTILTNRRLTLPPIALGTPIASCRLRSQLSISWWISRLETHRRRTSRDSTLLVSIPFGQPPLETPNSTSLVNIPFGEHQQPNKDLRHHVKNTQSSKKLRESPINPLNDLSFFYNHQVNSRNVTRLIGYFNSNVDIELDDVQTRKVKLEECYQAFSKIQFEIEILAEEAQIELDHETERAQFDDQYFKCAKFINQRLRELEPSHVIAEPGSLTSQPSAISGSNITISNNSLLPKIEIRPFDGNPIQWYSFHDTFQSLVHNDTNIPAVQKFYLLKNSLVGSVATIIDQLTASEENYHVAWDLLKQRCDRPRQIIQTHIKAILELPEIAKESPYSIRALKESALMHVNALKALKEPIEAWNSILTYVIVRKLDKNTRRTWERTLDNTQMPKFTELIEFLNKQERGDEAETNNMIGNQSQIRVERNANKFGKVSSHRVQAFIGTERRNECYLCNGNHTIYACENFLKLTPRERSNTAKNKRLCLNCLRNNHPTNKCMASSCKHYHRKHNTLLHFVEAHNAIRVDTGSKENPHSSTSTEQVKQGYTVTYNSEVLLGTARIKILDNNNHEHECRVLLDGCSQCHFITDKLAQKLQLNKEKIDLPFAGLGQLTTRAEYRVKATIKSKTSKFQSEVEFVALPRITSLLPSRRVHRKELSIPNNIPLADPEFDKPAEIDALIGTTLFYKLLNIGQIKLSGAADVRLQKTMLGWIVVGDVHKSNNNSGSNSCHLITSLDNQLTRFWEVEEVPHKKHRSLEETKCETLYMETTKRDRDGRYIVQLPFNDKRNNIGQSYGTALNRFYSIERKLARDKVLQQYYSNFLREYRDLGHMRDITQSDNKQEGYYIPHHAVIKEDSLSTNVRVVFDASAKSMTNVSLNDAMMVGPPIQGDLIFIIMRFRLHNVVLAADLQKMYRQVKVVDSDAIYQKILWRECENETIRVFQLNTVTQGTASAPFLASRTLHQLADDEGHKFPLAAISLKNDFYVDDLLSGANTIQEALELKRQVTQILKLGGFELHKWASNKSEVIARANNDEAQAICLNTESRKLLGIHWDSIGDAITYSVKPFAAKKHSTKRTILSQIAQLFDPLGLLGPVITLAKLVMQGLWKAKVEWDESLPQEMHTKWIEFKKELPLLSQFKVSRQVILANAHDIQLHGFCDASETAYGACVYVRSSNKENNSLVQLICAKSRVAPIKTITIPRLELCAAQLLARLVDTVSRSLNLKYSKIQLWSDSTIVLHWIQTSPHCLKTFVANRVAEIQSLTNVSNWFHVSTEDNPADYISRGQTPSEFIKNTHWQHGPVWLSQRENNWKVKHLLPMIVPEQRVKTALVIMGKVAKDNSGEHDTKNDTLERFSSINALIKFVAFCHRAVSNRKSANKKIGKFTIEELKNARVQIIRVIQQTHFSRDIKNLQQGIQLNAKTHFLIGGSLSSIPELDVQDVHTNRLSMWQRVQQVKQHFWNRWHKEYLNELRTKSKWHQGDGRQIEIGQLVMIKEDNLPPMQWSMGRIVQVHPAAGVVIGAAIAHCCWRAGTSTAQQIHSSKEKVPEVDKRSISTQTEISGPVEEAITDPSFTLTRDRQSIPRAISPYDKTFATSDIARNLLP
ncbi:uncharacterized protein LOC122401314 [Colletes gigas]|uniref:uncharacterized protein LOC122401314 n=1 Tax=Colletes gigas TaxID=935657 RepID=UPI001C9A6EBB|nr:uncharacterized protein LOC122401314 [Colletes gigas]